MKISYFTARQWNVFDQKPVSIGMTGVRPPPDFGVNSDDACWTVLAGDVFVLNPAGRRLNSFGIS
jgi:hypothetical protein